MKLKKCTVADAPFLTCKKTRKLSMNDPSTTALPMYPDNVLDKALRPSPLIRKPINGKTGISQTNFIILFISNEKEINPKTYFNY
jgi:hypothetical protein